MKFHLPKPFVFRLGTASHRSRLAFRELPAEFSHHVPIAGPIVSGIIARLSRDEMLPASDVTMGTAYERIGRGDAVWQDEAGKWRRADGLPPLPDPVSPQHSNKPRVSDPRGQDPIATGQSNWTEEAAARLKYWTEPCHEIAGEGIQAPLDYPLDDYSILYESPPCQAFSSLHDPNFLDRSSGIRRRAWLLEHGTWWQRVKAWLGFTS